jgi:hypothetical protein
MRLASVLAALPLVLACGTAQDGSQMPEGASPAANAMIERAATPEEREALIAIRDQVDAEKRKEAAALDTEIERLERENAALRARR